MVDEQLKNIQEKLQQVLKRLTVLQKENDWLNKQYQSLKKTDVEKTETIDTLQQRINILQAASGNMSPEEKSQFEKRITGFIKQIEKFIGMLSK
jgi:chromosome segregation ATPase